MVLAPRLDASVMREDADVMLCSGVSLVGGATFYTDFVKFYASQSEVVEHFHNQLSRKSYLPICSWKKTSKHAWSY